MVLLAALAVGWLRGGGLDRLGAHPPARPALVGAALLVQVAGTLAGGPLHALGLAVGTGLVVAFLLANRGLRGTGLVALGLGANALVVAANGAMPVSESAAARAGVPLAAIGAGLDPRHELRTGATRLPLLGDVVPVPLPLRPEVVSPGDVLVAAGLGQLVVLGMATGAGRSGPPPSAGTATARTPAPGPAAPRRRPARP